MALPGVPVHVVQEPGLGNAFGGLTVVGMGMYGAFAAGGPLGLALLDRLGFAGLMGVCTALPLPGLVAVHRLPAVAPHFSLCVLSRGWPHAGLGLWPWRPPANTCCGWHPDHGRPWRAPC